MSIETVIIEPTSPRLVIVEVDLNATSQGGGATSFGELSDAGSADIPSINTPLANAIATLTAAIGERATVAALDAFIATLSPVATSGSYGDLNNVPTEFAPADHTSAKITDFQEAVQDAVAALLGAGTNISLTYDDAANSLTITGAATSDPEAIRDAIGVALVGVGPISVAVDDAADTITISTTATTNSTDAALRDRSTHTGTQPQSTIDGLVAALAAKAASGDLATVATSGDYDDLTNKPPVVVSDPTGITGATTITNFVKMSQADYDALGTYDAATEYTII